MNVFNKADTLEDAAATRELLERTEPEAFLISAKSGAGLEELKTGIMEALYEKMIEVELFLPYQEGALIALFHDEGLVTMTESRTTGVVIAGSIPGRYFVRFQPYLKSSLDEEAA